MLSRKERVAQKRNEKVNELMSYFTQARNAIAVQYPREAVAVAMERTEEQVQRLMRSKPQEKSFLLDVLIELRKKMIEAGAEFYSRKALAV